MTNGNSKETLKILFCMVIPYFVLSGNPEPSTFNLQQQKLVNLELKEKCIHKKEESEI